MKRGMTSLARAAPLAIGLLLAGIALDFGFAQPQRRAVESMRRQRAELLSQSAELTGRDVEERRLALYLDAEDLASALASQRGEDPVNILGAAVEKSGLQRLELGTQASAETERLRRSRLFLRALGSYGQVVSLVSSLEREKRLISIDALTVQRTLDSGDLELRVDLSIYEPKK
jgi:hypothetical protein